MQQPRKADSPPAKSKSDDAKLLASETRALENFAAWVVKKITDKKQEDQKALDAKTRDSKFIESATDANLRLLNTEISELLQQLMATFRVSTLLGTMPEHYDAHLQARGNPRAALINLLLDTTVEFLKQKSTTNYSLFQVLTTKRAQIDAVLQQIEALDQTNRLRHAAQMRTLADEMNELGFIPEVDVVEMKLHPHKMSERDMRQVLDELVSGSPIVTKDDRDAKAFEIVIVKPPLDFSTGSDIFAHHIEAAEKELNKATKVTLLYPANDGKSHYEFLEVSLDRSNHFSLTLQNSFPNPGTTNTATHKVFNDARDVLNKLAAKRKDGDVKADLKFTGKQKVADAVSCSFHTIQSIVQRSVPAKMDEMAERYKDIGDSKNLDDLKLKVTQRLVKDSVAKQLQVDPVTHVVFRADASVKQQADLERYKAVHVARAAEQKEMAAIEQKLQPNAYGFRNLFNLPVKKTEEKSKTPLTPLVDKSSLATVKIQNDALTNNAKVLEVLTRQEIELSNSLNKVPVDRPMDYAKIAATIYHDKEQVDAYKSVLNNNVEQKTLRKDEKMVKTNLSGIDTVRSTIAENIDLLVKKSNASVDQARQSFKLDATNANKAETDAVSALEAAKKASEDAAKKADDKKAVEAAKQATVAAKKAMGRAHEQHTIGGSQFAKVELNQKYAEYEKGKDAAIKQQEIEDEKLAHILQNQDLLNYFFRPAKAVDQKQISADEALARQLQDEENKKQHKHK